MPASTDLSLFLNQIMNINALSLNAVAHIGSTSADHGGKNKTGSFYQPKLVVTDPQVLGTLDQRVYTEGFGEVAKYAILDGTFLPELERDAESLAEFSLDNLNVLGRIIARCVKQKAMLLPPIPTNKLQMVVQHIDNLRVRETIQEFLTA